MVDKVESVNRANLKRLNVKELRALENSDNVSRHTKVLAFNELTVRNKTNVIIERIGDATRKRKNKAGGGR